MEFLKCVILRPVLRPTLRPIWNIKMIYIGNEYKYTGNHPEYKNNIVHCLDTDAINQKAKISIPDINGLCWDWVWTDFKDLDVEM